MNRNNQDLLPPEFDFGHLSAVTAVR
jgi:hypothetical protein